MISFLHGKLVEKKPPIIVMDVQGVGYEVEVPMTTIYALPEIGNATKVYTHLAIRDDAHLLFGFATLDERTLFRTLIKVNGVGAKMALTILSGIEASEFARCVQDNDSATLVKLPGVGKKTAERLIIEMRDKLDGVINSDTVKSTPMQSSSSNVVDDATTALISLGYKPQEASKFVMAVVTDDMDSEAIIREALKASVK